MLPLLLLRAVALARGPVGRRTPAALDFQVLPAPCPVGFEYVTLDEARDNSPAICLNLTEWMIAEVGEARGPGIGGAGYDCAIVGDSCADLGSCGHSVCKPVPGPPPAPRQCFSKTPRGQDLRLNASVTQSSSSGIGARSTSHSEHFVSEVSCACRLQTLL
jgi:hypothetical protein